MGHGLMLIAWTPIIAFTIAWLWATKEDVG